MSFFHRNCPCCGAKISTISIYSKKTYNSKNCKLNFKCFHCQTCKNKISNEVPVFIDAFLAVIILIFSMAFANKTIEYFSFRSEDLTEFIRLLFWVLYGLVFGFLIPLLYATFVPLKCTKLTPNEYDNQPDSNILFKGKNGINLGEFDDDVRIDPLERKVMFNMVMFPTYMFLLTMLVLVVYIIYDNVFN